MKRLIAITVMLSAVCPASTYAQSSTVECQKLFKRADVDGDGALQSGEASLFLDRMDEAQVKRSDPSIISYEEFMIACRKGNFTRVDQPDGLADQWAGPPPDTKQNLQSGEDENIKPAQQEEQHRAIPNGLRASKLLGLPVYTMDEAHVGKVRDLIMSNDLRNTQLILGVGGFLGMGERYVAVEISQLNFVTKGNELVVVLDAVQDDLESFSTFEGQ